MTSTINGPKSMKDARTEGRNKLMFLSIYDIRTRQFHPMLLKNSNIHPILSRKYKNSKCTILLL